MTLRNLKSQLQLLLGQVAHDVRGALRDSADLSDHIEASSLEERLLMSASPAAVVAAGSVLTEGPVEPTQPIAPASAPESAVDAHHGGPDATLQSPVASPAIARPDQTADAERSEPVALVRELVFVDSRVTDLDKLLERFQAESGRDGRTLDVVVLDADRDGIAQVTDVLASGTAHDGIHIVSHGTQGRVQLGSAVLSLETIDTYRPAIAAWQHGLSDQADLLFYGCDLAASADGRELMRQIAAASEDLTGHAEQGGDWELEYTIGDVETTVFVSQEAAAHWRHTLELASLTATQDTSLSDDDQSDNFGGRPAEIDTLYSDVALTNMTTMQSWKTIARQWAASAKRLRSRASTGSDIRERSLASAAR